MRPCVCGMTILCLCLCAACSRTVEIPVPHPVRVTPPAHLLTPTPEPVPVRPLFACTHERYRWLMHNPDARTDADSAWLRDYRRGEEYADLKDLYAAEGIA